jgi:hypothetical protein
MSEHHAGTVALPNTLDEITPTFLTAALSSGAPGTEVGDVRITDLHQGSASSLRLLGKMP